jgi:hypothetical protein
MTDAMKGWGRAGSPLARNELDWMEDHQVEFRSSAMGIGAKGAGIKRAHL